MCIVLYMMYVYAGSLLLIAVLHFAIWSLGVCEPSSQIFFAREIANCKSVDIRASSHITDPSTHNYDYLSTLTKSEQQQKQAELLKSYITSTHTDNLDFTHYDDTSQLYIKLHTTLVHRNTKQAHFHQLTAVSYNINNNDQEGNGVARTLVL